MKYIAHSHSCTECKGASKGLCHAILTSFQNSKYVLPPIEFQTFRVFMYSLSLSFSGYKSQNLMILVFKYTNSCSRMQEMHSKRPKFQKFPGGNPPPPSYKFVPSGIAPSVCVVFFPPTLQVWPPTKIIIENPANIERHLYCCI